MAMRLWVGLVLFFLYAPLITLVAFSSTTAAATSCGAASRWILRKGAEQREPDGGAGNSLTIAALARLSAWSGRDGRCDAVALPLSVQGRNRRKAHGAADRGAGNLPGRRLPGVLRQDRLPGPPNLPWPFNLGPSSSPTSPSASPSWRWWCGRAWPASTRRRRSRRKTWAPANGRLSATCCCRT
jgi:hypothetical protein